MFKILFTLIIVRLRKILPKDDFFAYLLFFIFFGVSSYILSGIYVKFSNYILLFSLEILLYHSNRKDLELLKTRKNYLLIIFLEYLFYSLPTILIILLNKDFVNLYAYLIVLFLYTLTSKRSFRIIKYPFKLLNPFWHISFRKYNLLFFLPLLIFLNYIGWQSNNENLNIASLFVASILGCIPSFEREELQYIKMSYFQSRKYITEQIKCIFFNASFLSIPIILCFIVLEKWNLLFFVPLVYFFPITNILLKYSFYSNALLQQIFFILFVVNTQNGLSLLALPFLYYKSYKTIEQIQHAKN